MDAMDAENRLRACHAAMDADLPRLGHDRDRTSFSRMRALAGYFPHEVAAYLPQLRWRLRGITDTRPCTDGAGTRRLLVRRVDLLFLRACAVMEVIPSNILFDVGAMDHAEWVRILPLLFGFLMRFEQNVHLTPTTVAASERILRLLCRFVRFCPSRALRTMQEPLWLRSLISYLRRDGGGAVHVPGLCTVVNFLCRGAECDQLTPMVRRIYTADTLRAIGERMKIRERKGKCCNVVPTLRKLSPLTGVASSEPEPPAKLALRAEPTLEPRLQLERASTRQRAFYFPLEMPAPSIPKCTLRRAREALQTPDGPLTHADARRIADGLVRLTGLSRLSQHVLPRFVHALSAIARTSALADLAGCRREDGACLSPKKRKRCRSRQQRRHSVHDDRPKPREGDGHASAAVAGALREAALRLMVDALHQAPGDRTLAATCGNALQMCLRHDDLRVVDSALAVSAELMAALGDDTGVPRSSRCCPPIATSSAAKGTRCGTSSLGKRSREPTRSEKKVEHVSALLAQLQSSPLAMSRVGMRECFLI
jgi:hypothetical protein